MTVSLSHQFRTLSTWWNSLCYSLKICLTISHLKFLLYVSPTKVIVEDSTQLIKDNLKTKIYSTAYLETCNNKKYVLLFIIFLKVNIGRFEMSHCSGVLILHIQHAVIKMMQKITWWDRKLDENSGIAYWYNIITIVRLKIIIKLYCVDRKTILSWVELFTKMYVGQNRITCHLWYYYWFIDNILTVL